MVKVIGVRFRSAGKIYYFDPVDLEIEAGDKVIVETARGIEFGYVMTGAREISESLVVQPLKPVIRKATEEDEEREEKNRVKEKEAFQICQEKIAKHQLEMKLIDAEYTFDNNKVLFYFTADGRIDFRDLVKDLAAVFKTRIELRQIGVRDETKLLGGIGICGRPLCCHTYLADFAPVSIKMAKEQNLSLNPTKISGVCGRLMCCLKNEEDTYEYLNSKLPNTGDRVITSDGLKGEVTNVSVLRQTVKVLVILENDEREIREYKVDDLRFKSKRRKERMELTDEELKALEEMDMRDYKDTARSQQRGQNREGRGNQNRGGQNRDHQNREGQNRDGQNRERQVRDGQNRERPSRDGQNREAQNKETQNRDGQNREGQRRDGRRDGRRDHRDRRKGKPEQS